MGGAPSNHAPRPWLKVAIVAIFVAAMIAFFALGGPSWLSLDSVRQNRDALLDFVGRHHAAAILLAAFVYVAVTALSVPGALVLSLTMGFLFGRWVGTGVIVVSATLGATLVFLAARYLFADAARRRFGATGERINAGFTRNAFSYLLFLRLVPLFPFFLVNVAPALTTVPTRTYVLATMLGIVPGSFVFANLGQALGRIESTSQLVSTQTVAALVLLGLLALVPVVVKRVRARRGAAEVV